MCYLFCKKRILHKIFLDIKKRLVLNKTGHFLKSGHCCVGAFLRRLKESLMLASTYRFMTWRKCLETKFFLVKVFFSVAFFPVLPQITTVKIAVGIKINPYDSILLDRLF